MALATYTDLSAAIANWLRRYDLGAQIPDFIALAEANMNRILRTSRQLITEDFLIDAEFVAMPTEFRMLRSLRLTSGTWRLLRPMTPEQMAEQKAIPAILTMEPRAYTAGGGQFEFWPVPDTAYTAKIEYQLQIPPLGPANPSNWVLTDHPDCYLWGALSAASAFLKNDDRAVGLQGQFMQAMAAMQASMRTSYARTLRVDPGLQNRSPRTFNWISGDTV